MSSILKKLKSRFEYVTYQGVVLKLIIAITAVSFFETAFSPFEFNTPEYFNNISLVNYSIAVALIFLSLFFFIDTKHDPYIIMVLLCALFFITNYTDRGVYFALASSAVVCGFIFYLGDRLKFISLNNIQTKTICIVLGILFALFVGGITVVKFLNHRTPNFDFGIFSQIYHYMKETFLPLATCERDKLLSHFAVHFSPALYLLLPFYFIFPSPSTLLWAQAILVALGIIPLYKLSKHFGLSNNKTVAIIILYVLHPTVIANNFYYFHENCFLTLFLLCMFYFAEKKKCVPTFIFAFLTMSVKEDAPVYVFIFGIYLLLSNKGKIKGLLLSLFSGIYFVVVTKLMDAFGEGIMSYRYENFIFDEKGTLFDAVINIFKNPAYLFSELLTPDKIVFLIYMLIPLACLPFIIKKPSNIVLLGPLVLINLMSDYTYQHNISFQYTYASIAFLFYLLILNIKDITPKYAKRLLLCGICSSLLFFASFNYHKIDALNIYNMEKDTVSTINEVIDTIPKDKSVRVSTFLLPAMSDRNEIYEYYYSDEKTDYVVFDLRWNQDDFKKFAASEGSQYENVTLIDGIIAVYIAK